MKSSDTRLLSRREFNERSVALGSLVTLSGALALDGASAVAATGTARTVKFRDGTIVTAIGQGSWHIGQGRHPAADEEEALRTGLSLGMTLIVGLSAVVPCALVIWIGYRIYLAMTGPALAPAGHAEPTPEPKEPTGK